MADYVATTGTDTVTQTLDAADTVTVTASDQVDASDFFDGNTGTGIDAIVIGGDGGVSVDLSLAGTDATHGFHNYEGLTFANTSGTSSATFDAAQFGTDLISTSLAVTGAAGTQSIVINNASDFSAASWTFSTWTSGTDAITVNGTGGNDTITGSSQIDTIIGDAGDDTITGGAGADTLTGGPGADTFVIAAAADLAGDTIDGTAEQGTLDTLRLDASGTYSLASTVTNIDQIAFNENATFQLTATDSQVSTADANGDGTLNDLKISALVAMTNGVTIDASGLTGTNHIVVDATNLGGFDTITGGAGADTIDGGAGLDTITGGAGNDTITGGDGGDTLTGGLGADTFVIAAAADLDGDTIDGTAEQGTLDTLRLDAAGTYSLASTVTNIDQIAFNENASFHLTVTDSQVSTADANGDGTLNDLKISASVATTNGVTINASGLTGTNHIVVDATNLGGDDTITGGAGVDTLTGGLGADTFVIATAADLTGDTIDGTAEQGTLDTLRLDAAGTYSLASTVTNIDQIVLNQSASFHLTVTDSQVSTADANGDGTMNDMKIFGHSLPSPPPFGPGGPPPPSQNNQTIDVTIDASGLTGTNHIVVDGANLRGNESITGGAGADAINGGAGNDTITGGAGADTLTGGSGNDTITGGAGADTLTGGLGADTFAISALADLAGDTIDGTAEQGTLDTLRLDAGGTYSLASTVTNIDQIVLNQNASFHLTVTDSQVSMADANGDGTMNDLKIFAAIAMTMGVTIDASGLTGTNHIVVDGTNLRGADTITGGAGADSLTGGAGIDWLNGGAGNDTLTGGAGKDFLFGGADADTFDFNSLKDSAKGSTRDRISDFSHAERDHIDLSTIDGNTHKGGNQAFHFIGSHGFTHHDGELRFSGHVLQGDVNGDGKADFEIFVNAASLHGADFFL